MTPEQQRAIDTFLAAYAPKPEFPAILLAGSLAHGFAKPTSDVDILLVATEAEFERRVLERKLTFSLWDVCEYEGGYIDCKVVSIASLQQVRERGSDPARYAFKDARILHSRLPELGALLDAVAQFPVQEQDARRHRFLCQLLAWKWYLSQSIDKANPYLITLAVQKLVLFACRVVLNENELLYPFHKWLLEETRRAPRQPEGFMALLDALMAAPTMAAAQALSDRVFAFAGRAEKETDWPNQFMRDSELNWLEHEAPVDDL